jgi:hypothetical protein
MIVRELMNHVAIDPGTKAGVEDLFTTAMSRVVSTGGGRSSSRRGCLERTIESVGELTMMIAAATPSRRGFKAMTCVGDKPLGRTRNDRAFTSVEAFL